MNEPKNAQPSHQHKRGTCLATRHARMFSRLLVNRPSHCFQVSHYLEAWDWTIMEMANAVIDPLTGA